MYRPLVFVFCTLVLTACQLANGMVEQPNPALDLPQGKTAAAETAIVQPTAELAVHPAASATVETQLTEDASKIKATPSPSITPVTVATTSNPSRTPLPTPFPPIELTKVPNLLQSEVSVEALAPFNEHNLRRITGWSYGFESFQWMDTNHLLLYPITGQVMIEMAGKVTESYPSVVNLSSERIWFPPSNVPVRKYGTYNGPMLPRWSDQLGALLASETDTSTGMYDSEGNLLKTYEGNLIGVSPSVTKILVSELFGDSTWIDLRNGTKVTFPWKNINRQVDSSYIRPIWSPDEMRVYAGYHIYGDAKTGENFEMPGTTIDGENTDLLFVHFYGTWVLGGKYMLAQWDGLRDGTPGFVAFFDPAAKTYRNLSALAGLPYELSETAQTYSCSNYSPSTIPGGRYVWVNCVDGGRLIDLIIFKSQVYPDYLEASLDWSADGNFALIRHESDPAPKILSASTKELNPMPQNYDPNYDVWWHPADNILAYFSNEGQTLSFFNTLTMSVQKEAALPAKFQNAIWWNSDGKHIALIARDRSLWRIDYPNLENLEQLTPPMANVRDISWSPDGTLLAFIGDTDIYIVDTQAKP